MLFAVLVVAMLAAAAAMFASKVRATQYAVSRPSCPVALALSDSRIGDRTGPRATCMADAACLSVSTHGASPL